MATQFQEGYLDELPDYKEPSKTKAPAQKFKEGYLDEVETSATTPNVGSMADQSGTEARFWDENVTQPKRLTPEDEEGLRQFYLTKPSAQAINDWWKQRGFGGLNNAAEVSDALRSGKRQVAGVNYGLSDNPPTAEDIGYAQADAVQDDLEESDREFAKLPIEDQQRIRQANQAAAANAPVASAPPVEGFWSGVGTKAKEAFSEAGETLSAAFMRNADEAGEEESIRFWIQQNGGTPEEAEAVIQQARDNRARMIQEERASRGRYWNDQDARSDRWSITNFARDILGEAIGDPVGTFVPQGGAATRIGRVGEATLVNTGIDAAVQANEINEGIQKDFDFGRSALNAVTGAAVQGGFELPGAVRDSLRTPEIPNAGSVTTPVEGEPGLPGPMGMEGEPGIPGPRFTPKTEPEAPSTPPKFTVDEVVDRFNNLAARWKNPPKIEVVQSAKELGDDVDPDALGFIGDDGKVRVIADNLQSEADIPAVLYHEALGHHGLIQRFGKGLDDLLNRMYKSEGVKKIVDTWLEANPQYKELYAEDANPQARIVEEYLVSLGESGQLPPPNLLAAIKFYLKELGRKMKIKGLDYTDEEVMTIIKMAHNATINGKPNAASNGFRYAKVYHGSPADFDEFDHNYMGSGEGQQVFGWGTYLSESEGIARSYRDKLSEVKRTWGGMEQTAYQVRNNAQYYAQDKYGWQGEEVTDAILAYMDSTANDKPDTPEQLFNWYHEEPSWTEHEGSRWSQMNEEYRKKYTEIFDDINSKLGVSKKGKFYEVEIPDDAEWVDWNFQPTEKVKKAFEDLGIVSSKKWSEADLKNLGEERSALLDEVSAAHRDVYQLEAKISDEFGDNWKREAIFGANAGPGSRIYAMAEQLSELTEVVYKLEKEVDQIDAIFETVNPTGEQLYKQLVDKLGSDKKASQALASKGIAGNKYAANSLSGRPDFNTFNYVVFDDKTPKITKKYMKKVDKRDALKSDSRFRMEDKRLRRETKLSNYKSYEDWKRNWEFDEFIDELEQSSPSRYMKRKGESEGPQTNFGRRGTNAEARPYVPMGNVRSNRPGVISILEEAAPVKDRQTQDEWIAASNEVRKSAKQHQKALNPGSEPAEVLAARDSSLKLANRLTDLSVKIRDGMATDNEKWQLEVGMAQLADLLEAIDGVVSNAGRVLRSMGIEVANDAAQLAKVRALLRNKSNLSADEIAEKLADANFDPNATAQLAKDNFKPSKLDYITSIRYSAMLSGLTTPSKAIVGTMSNMLLRNASYAGSMFTGKVKPGEWQAYNLGMIRSIVEASRAFKESYGLGVASNSPVNRLELQEGVKLPFSKVTEYPRRTLAGIDAFFREIIRGGEVNALAYRQALNEGFTPNTPEFEARADYLVGLPMDEVALQLKNAKTAKTKDKALIERLEEEYKLLRNIDKLATKQANLQQLLDNDSMVLKGLEAAGRHGPVSRFIVQNSLPFVRNVDNIARMAGRNSWLGLLSPYVRGELKASPERRALMISQMNVGSLLIGLAGYMGYNELAVPSNSDDRDMAAIDQAMGKTPGSIKIGDEWVSLAGLDAIAVPFITAATTAKAYKDGRSDEMSYAMATLSAFDTMVKAFADETIIGQLEQFTGLFERGSNYSEFLAALPSSFMPAAVRQYTQWGEDRTVLDTRGDKSMTDRAIGRVLAGTPEAARKWLIDTFGLSELPQKLDLFGRPIYREGDAVAAITGVGRGGKEETDPAIREVYRLSQLAGKAAVTKTPDDFTVDGEKVKLTPEQRMKWQYDAGQYILSDIKEAMADPVWKTLSDAEKFEEIQIITKEAKDDAKWDNFRDILETDPDNQPIEEEEDPVVYEGYVEE